MARTPGSGPTAPAPRDTLTSLFKRCRRPQLRALALSGSGLVKGGCKDGVGQVARPLPVQLFPVSQRSRPLPGLSRPAWTARTKFAAAAAAAGIGGGSTDSQQVPRRRGPDQLSVHRRFD